VTVSGPPPAPPSTSLPIINLVDKDPQAEWIMQSLMIAQNPLHPGGYLGRGISLISMNRLDEAMADAEMAIRLAPRESEPYRLRGRVRRAGGDSKAALADFHKAVEFGPDSRAAHAERANIAQQLRDDPTFLESARRMTELSPRAFGWWQALAAGLLVAEAPQRDVDAARVAAGQAARLNATNAFNHTVVGYALLESGRPEDAEKAFVESRRLRPPGNYDALNLFGLALCAHAADDAPKARTLFAQAVAAKDSGRLHTDLAERLMVRMYAQAAKALELPPPKR
jgi:tetratricopeptide (TPR) repeat protein